MREISPDIGCVIWSCQLICGESASWWIDILQFWQSTKNTFFHRFNSLTRRWSGVVRGISLDIGCVIWSKLDTIMMRLEFVNKINSKDEHYGLDISSNGCVKTTVLTRYHSNMVCDPPGDIGTNMGEVRPRSSDIGRDQDASRLIRPISLDSANSPSSAKSPADTYHIIIGCGRQHIEWLYLRHF